MRRVGGNYVISCTAQLLFFLCVPNKVVSRALKRMFHALKHIFHVVVHISHALGYKILSIVKTFIQRDS